MNHIANRPDRGRRRRTVVGAGVTVALALGLISGCTSGSAPKAQPAKTSAAPPVVAHTSHRAPQTYLDTLATKVKGTGHLQPGSDPAALPFPILIADKLNNRLIIVDPHGRLIWQYPQRGDLKKGQTFKIPDDAFFTPDGRKIIATEEDDSIIRVIDIRTRRVIFHYGHSGQPGSATGYVHNPDDALMLPDGTVVSADIINCRWIAISQRTKSIQRQFGRTGDCLHNPPATYGSPNGAFPLTDGNFLITEINGSWVDEVTPKGAVKWSAHLPSIAYPSDSNEVRPGVYLTVDYSTPGQVVEFNKTGKILWRYAPRGAAALNHPSLALPLPNGNVLLNDDYNHRVIVIDRHSDKIVWQYGVDHVSGRSAGELDNPDGIDLSPPHSLMMTHAATVGHP